MQINFYILAANKSLSHFVCQLTQTVLAKSDESLVIFADEMLLTVLDEQLWSFSDTAFIPHQIVTDTSHDMTGVVLTDNLAMMALFDGVVMNLTDKPLIASQGIDFTGSKLLEIISDENLEKGRQKFRAYRQHLPEQNIQTFHV